MCDLTVEFLKTVLFFCHELCEHLMCDKLSNLFYPPSYLSIFWLSCPHPSTMIHPSLFVFKFPWRIGQSVLHFYCKCSNHLSFFSLSPIAVYIHLLCSSSICPLVKLFWFCHYNSFKVFIFIVEVLFLVL